MAAPAAQSLDMNFVVKLDDVAIDNDNDDGYRKWEETELANLSLCQRKRRAAFLAHVDRLAAPLVTDPKEEAAMTPFERLMAKTLIFGLYARLDREGYNPGDRLKWRLTQRYELTRFEMTEAHGHSPVLHLKEPVTAEAGQRMCRMVQRSIDRAVSVSVPPTLQPAQFTDAEMCTMMLESELDGIRMIPEHEDQTLVLPYKYGGMFRLRVTEVPGCPVIICQGWIEPHGDRLHVRRFQFHGRVFEERSGRHAGYLMYTHNERNQFLYADARSHPDKQHYNHIPNFPPIPTFGANPQFIGVRAFVQPWVRRWQQASPASAKLQVIDEMSKRVDLVDPNPDGRNKPSLTNTRVIYKRALLIVVPQCEVR